MGLRYSIYIDADKLAQGSTTYGCGNCKTHLSSSSLIISKDYRGRTGDAYLMEKVVNVVQGEKQYRHMITGRYLVSDIMCHQCGHCVGWKYHQSDVKHQKYKEGKYILEVKTIARCK